MAKTNGATGIARVSGYNTLPQDETQIQYALLTYGPISVTFYATSYLYSYGFVKKKTIASTDCFERERERE